MKDNNYSLKIEEINAAKGIWILLIVIGHLHFIGQDFPHIKNIIYSFHVDCFLFLPFLFQLKKLSKRNIIDFAV
ncbi:MAG: hypothetical protein PVI26_10800, partial [Chitinispirillia bacterium]